MGIRYVLMLLLFMGETSSQDIMSPNVDILKELSKITSIETRLKQMEEEVKQLRTQNEDLQKLLETQSSHVNNSQRRTDAQLPTVKDNKVAFSASLQDQPKKPTVFGPFPSMITLIYKHVFINIGEAYNPSTGVFLAPQTAVYAFRVFSKSSGSGSVTAGLFKNGQHILSTHGTQTAGFYSTSNGVTLLLEKGDTVSVRLYPGTQIFDNAEHHHSTFSGHLLFPL